ncbi:MAG: hypothetical protein WCW66_05195 [Patescibacteria group bacterium]
MLTKIIKFLKSKEVILFMCIFFVYIVNPYILGTWDGYPNQLLPISIVEDQDFYLDEFADNILPEKIPYSIRLINGHFVSLYPPGVALLVSPLYIIPVLANILNSYVAIMAMVKIAAAILASLSAIFIYKILKKFISGNWSLIITLLYAFSTCHWVITSQDLWKNTGTEFLLTASLLLLFSERVSKNRIVLLGFMVGALITIKQLNIVFIGLFSIYILIQYRKYIWQYIGGLIPPILFIIAYNIVYLGSISDIGYGEGVINPLMSNQFSNSLINIPVAFLGLFFSPARGMLFFSPVLIFAFIGMGLVFKKKNVLPPNLLLLLKISVPVLFFYSVLVSRWITWWGGSVYGYRMVLDLLPFIILFFIPVIHSNFWKRKSVLYIFFGLLIISVFVQLVGVVSWDSSWFDNLNMNSITDPHSKVFWSITDSPIFHYTRRFFGKY